MWKTERNGKLYLCDRLYDSLTGKASVVSVKIEKDTKAGLKEAEIQLCAKMNKKKKPDAHNLRLSEMIELYLKEQEKTVAPSTLRRNGFSLTTVVNILDDVYVNELTAGYIRAKYLDTGRPASFCNESLTRFKACLRWAYRNDYLQDYGVIEKLSNFADTSRKEKNAAKYLELDELKALLDVMTVERWRLFTRFLALTGLRVDEAIALDKSDISADEISITKSADAKTGEIGPTKTADSTRTIYIQDELRALLSEIKVYNGQQALACGYGLTAALWVDTDGQRIRYDAYRKYLRISGEKALNRHITPHILRHTHTSLLAAAGVPLEVISRRLGHSDSAITKEVYLHVTQGLKERDAHQLANVYLIS